MLNGNGNGTPEINTEGPTVQTPEERRGIEQDEIQLSKNVEGSGGGN